MAEGSLVGQSSNLCPYRAGLSTYDWWRRPASPRLWRDHPVHDAREIHLQECDPEEQERWQKEAAES